MDTLRPDERAAGVISGSDPYRELELYLEKVNVSTPKPLLFILGTFLCQQDMLFFMTHLRFLLFYCSLLVCDAVYSFKWLSLFGENSTYTIKVDFYQHFGGTNPVHCKGRNLGNIFPRNLSNCVADCAVS